MKNTNEIRGLPRMLGWSGLFFLALALFVPWPAMAIGSWVKLLHAPPGSAPIDHLLLLSDGTVMAQQTSTTNIWFRLTPVNGSYVNGTWTTLTPMIYTRQFYASAVLRDGR